MITLQISRVKPGNQREGWGGRERGREGGREEGREGGREGTRAKPGNQLIFYRPILEIVL